MADEFLIEKYRHEIIKTFEKALQNGLPVYMCYMKATERWLELVKQIEPYGYSTFEYAATHTVEILISYRYEKMILSHNKNDRFI